MTKSDDANRCFMSRFTCSAAVFSAFSEDLGLDPDTAKKIACGFWALFVAMAGLVLARVLDPVTAQQVVGIIAGLGGW